MKIPKYIDSALTQRTKAAMAFRRHDRIISEYMKQQKITSVSTSDYYPDIECIISPKESEQTIRDYISKL